MKILNFLLLCLFVISLCRCKDSGENKVTSFTAAPPMVALYSNDSCGVVIPPLTTNIGEEKEDSIKIKKIESAIAKSAFESCNDVLVQYEKALIALKQGNRKLLAEFPTDEDPTITICLKEDKLFEQKMDSLRKQANKLLEEVSSINDKF